MEWFDTGDLMAEAAFLFSFNDILLPEYQMGRLTDHYFGI